MFYLSSQRQSNILDVLRLKYDTLSAKLKKMGSNAAEKNLKIVQFAG
jgi:hypothetical protein